jgi:hypothetical protein
MSGSMPAGAKVGQRERRNRCEPRPRSRRLGRLGKRRDAVEHNDGHHSETNAWIERPARAVCEVFERTDEARFGEQGTLNLNAFMRLLVPELDNVRAALDWAAGEARDLNLAVGLAGAAVNVFGYLGLSLRRWAACPVCKRGSTTPWTRSVPRGSGWESVCWPSAGDRPMQPGWAARRWRTDAAATSAGSRVLPGWEGRSPS